MKYLYYAKLAFVKSTAYRFEMVSSIVLAPFALAVQYFIWTALLSLQDTIAGYDITAAMTYFTTVTLVRYFTYNGAYTNMDDLIVKGELSRVLLRPVHLMKQVFFQVLGNRAMSIFVEIGPIIALIAVFFGPAVLIPAAPLVFIAGLLIALVGLYLFNYIVGMTGFWTKRTHGTRMINWSAYLFLSGYAFPLDIMPAKLQAISAYLPFQHFIYAPVKYFSDSFRLGAITDPIINIVLGIAWVAILYIGAIAIERRGMNKYQGVGQ